MNDSIPPTEPPAQPRNSRYHQAATASVLAPLISIGVTFLLAASRKDLNAETQRTVAVTVATTHAIILLFGLICGIVALCGIRKHGKAGILTKALLGLLIPVLLTALAVPNFLASRSRAARYKQFVMTPEGQVQAIADQLNSQRNKMVDEITRLDGAETLSNRTLLCKYTLTTKSSSDIVPDRFNAVVRPALVKRYNTLPEMKELRDCGATIIYRFKDKAGQLVGDVTVGPRDLEK